MARIPFLNREDTRLFYQLRGSGPPLLMLAGVASDGASWGPLAPLLEDRFRLVLIDNRGSGQTLSAGAISLEQMAEDCLALLDHLRIGRVHVVGHSLGGTLGLRLAARHSGRVERLVTLAASNRIEPKEAVLLSDMARLYSGGLAPEAWFRLLFQWLFAPAFFNDAAQVDSAAEAAAAYPYRQSPQDFSRQVAMLSTLAPVDPRSILCPVLAIAAGADLLIPPGRVRDAHQALADHAFQIIEGAGHSVHWDAPDAVAAAITEFLKP